MFQVYPEVGFVTVTEVHVTPDLRHARVLYTTMGDDRARRATAAGLHSATPHLRQVVGAQVRLKFLPELAFEEDDRPATAAHIEDLLRGLREADRDR